MTQACHYSRHTITLALVAIVLVQGCIPIPIPTRFAKGYNLKSHVGTLSTNRPIRIGQTTYAQFVKEAGPPLAVSSNHRFAIYHWNTTGYTWFWLILGVFPVPAFQDWDGSQIVTALVRFDAQGTLLGWQDTDDVDSDNSAHYMFCPELGCFLPPDAYAALHCHKSKLKPTTDMGL